MEESSESGFSIDGFKLKKALLGGGVSEEFMLNQVGMKLQEYIQNDFDSFMGSPPPRDQLKRKVKKKIDRVNRKGSRDD